MNNWFDTVNLKQVVHCGLLVPRFKILHFDEKYPNFQCREPVRIGSCDDPTAGQSNSVV